MREERMTNEFKECNFIKLAKNFYKFKSNSIQFCMDITF